MIIETHTLTRGLVNQARVGWVNYDFVGVGVPAPSGDVSALGLVNTFPQAGDAFPNFGFSNGLSQGGGLFGVPNAWGSSIWNGEDSVSWVHGKHYINLDAFIYVDSGWSNDVDNVLGSYSFDGSFTAPPGVAPSAGNSIADFLLGDIVSGQDSLPTPYGLSHPAPPPYYLDQNKYAASVSDNWKVNDRLTLDLGLRYDYQSWPKEQQAVWAVLTTPGGVLCTTDRQVIASGVGGSFYKYCSQNASKTPFAPRFGFAYRPFSDNKTVIRGGYGIFYDYGYVFEYDSAINFPWIENFSLSGYNFNDLFPTLPPTVTAADLSGIYHPQPNTFINPYTQEWSLGVERELARNTLLDVGYVGSNAQHLSTAFPANQPYAYNPSDTPLQREMEYPYYNFGTYGLNGTPFSPAYVLSVEDNGASHYDSLQASLNHRSKDLALLASFTWSSSMDDTSQTSGVALENAGWSGVMDAHDIHRDYSKSSFDVNKRFVTSFVYDLPFGQSKRFGSGVNNAANVVIGGWQVNGIYSYQTGIPFNTKATDIGFVLEAYQ